MRMQLLVASIWVGLMLQCGAQIRAAHVIADPATGQRWALERNAAHPGGPGRLVEIHPRSEENRDSEKDSKSLIAIHAGDRVIVVDKTARVEMRLEGVAQSPARAGEVLTVKLASGGWQVRAVALAPGSAHLEGKAEK